MRIIPALLATFLLAAAPAAAAPPEARGERLAFASTSPAGPTDLIANAGPPVTIEAWLNLPPGAAPFPAVVIAHGSGGIRPGREFAWAERLTGLGTAALVVDSFGPRSIRATGENQRQLSTMANVADALNALRLLAADPRIDPARIAVMGFSRGGQVALYTALEPLRRAVAGESLRFAAHVALYPSCNLPYFSRRVDGAPLLFALAGDDDYTPPQPCLRYAEWFRAQDAPVTTIVYPGARHGFDSPGQPRFMPTMQTARGCAADFELEPVLMRRRDTGETVEGAGAIDAFLTECMQRGAHFGGDADALRNVVADVGAFVRAVLRP